MALDAYLQLDGIQGDATDGNHKGWIKITKIGHGIEQQASKNPPGGQRHNVASSKHDAIQLDKAIDKSSPVLYENVCSGKPIGKATIELQKNTGTKNVVYMKYELTNVFIASVNFNADDAHNEDPSETIQLKYGTIKWTYSTTDENGSVNGNVPAGWDVAKNTKLGG